MKTIIFVRHAKSSWESSNDTDFDRPLNKRGLNDAPLMASKISALVPSVDIIYSSPANRAITTAIFFAEALNYDTELIVQKPNIYSNGFKFFNEMVVNIDSNFNTILLFGHNPDITSLATFYSGEYFENIPTCGVVCIDFDCDSWKEVKQTEGKIRFINVPSK